MQLDEALRTSPLQAGAVVAASEHLAREISWVQVVDHPDIESWVEPGHLLLSTGYNWPKGGKEAAALVEKLAVKGACGVVLAVPNFVEHFALETIAVADRVHLPLIELPWEVPFSSITQYVHRELVDRQSRALAKSEQIHRQLTEAAATGDSLQDVARVLGQVLERSVQIYSAEGGLLAAHAIERGGHASPSFEQGVFRALSAGGGIKAMDAQTRAVRWHPRPSRLATTAQSVVGCAVRNRNGGLGYVLVAEGVPPLTEIDLRAVEHAGTVAALQIAHQRELSANEARLGYALVAALLEGRFDETPSAIERARLLGWDPEQHYRLATILLDEPNPLSSEGLGRREQLAGQLAQAFRQKSVQPLISLSANQINALVPDTMDVEWLWSNIAHGRSAMGVSEFHRGVAGMHSAGREIADLMPHTKPSRIHFSEEAMFPRVLAGDAAARRIFITRLFGALEADKRGQALIDTAIALTDEGFNLQRTADRLEVHISTLRYRLGRLGELTKLDLDSVEGRFRLQLGVRLYLAEQS
ncbi:PucR family transcriptional regulator ligand-binding domain-containing protein [Variovorax paradoxus]|uniref:PucR family transcriptional regulator n=1 Tax=Variovorax paradoxus TaxID=34073 RepID=UPI0021AD0ED6|nr:PucR family transcriptional regulator [Variovorax paradoxus]UVH55150.1 PucR family transcriptional regulator ligand-binding domain-containing protein [Variovorax paradoxus]